MEQSAALDGQQCDMKHEAARYENWDRIDNKKRTRPSEASSSLTGHSRTDTTKQNEAGSNGVAVGYQVKSRIGAG